MRIGWLDPAVSSGNLGDQIIQDAVAQVLSAITPTDAEIISLPTQRFLSIPERRLAASCDHFVVGGTNILNGNIPRYIQWKLDPQIARVYAGKTTLLGVGWWQYQNLNRLSSRIWQYVLSGGIHSVRDAYTDQRVSTEIGLRSINTGCPTMWDLPDVLNTAPAKRTVVTTITDYHPNSSRDKRMLDFLASVYDEVLIWPQGSKDKAYLAPLVANPNYLDPTLRAFDEAIDSGADYFGTRLHAGVRAHQRSARSMIVAIDNRAEEISRDTGLPIVSNNLSQAELEAAMSLTSSQLRLPKNAIQEWRTVTSARLQAL